MAVSLRRTIWTDSSVPVELRIAPTLEEEVLYMLSIMRRVGQEVVVRNFGHAEATIKRVAETSEPVTAADLESSKRILAEICRRFPGSTSEEHPNPERFNYKYIWQLDPLDGTLEYCLKWFDKYAMLAALLEHTPHGCRPIAGIIYQPGTDEGAWGCIGCRPRLFQGDSEVPLPAADRSVVRGFMRQLDPSTKLQCYYQELGARLGLPVEIIAGGSSGQSFLSLLQGRINVLVMPYNYSKEWDIAMAAPLLMSLGGFLLDLEGGAFTFNRIDDVFNRRGYIASFAFKQEELFPLPAGLLEDRLGTPAI